MQDELAALDATSGSLSRRMEVSLSATLYLSTPVIMWDVGGRLLPQHVIEKVSNAVQCTHKIQPLM